MLEIGCGTGHVLASITKWGAKPEDLYDLDLLADRIELATHMYPQLHFEFANAEALTYPNSAYDLDLCFTVFSSILDWDMRVRVVKETLRVLKPGGGML